LTTTLRLGERAFREEFRMPARQGATHRAPGQMWRIASIGPGEDAALHLDLQFLRATTMFDSGGEARADMNPEPFSSRMFFLLNRKLGQYADGSPNWGNGHLGTVASVVARIDFRARRGGGAQAAAMPLDATWLADAEFVVVAVEQVGQTEKTVVVDDFELPRRYDEGGY
jgi:hypothetical protein